MDGPRSLLVVLLSNDADDASPHEEVLVEVEVKDVTDEASSSMMAEAALGLSMLFLLRLDVLMCGADVRESRCVVAAQARGCLGVVTKYEYE